ncbi:MAG: aryldialkylphosphatase [Alphaproteobacteria bacterium]|nr:aryldialkylphosphatase [Alphaproteobacteria bacterium]
MDRNTLRGKVQTVTGLLDPAKLGKTLMHEHLLCDLRTPTMMQSNEPDPEITLANRFAIDYGRIPHKMQYVMDMKDIAIVEMGNMKEVGGTSLVELTCGGFKPDPKGLQDISLATGVNVVMGCGYYVDEYQTDELRRRRPEDFAREITQQVFEGAWGTDVRAGIIGEIGCQYPWTDHEKRVMQGAVMAQKETGATLNIHPGRNEDLPLEIAQTVEKWGADMSRTIISHLDRTVLDEERLLKLAATGVGMEFDLFGTEQTFYSLNKKIDRPNDGRRLQLIRALIDAGYLKQVLISHDICSRTRLTAFGGHGYGHIFVNVLPLMKDRGYSDEEIEVILVDNPARYLTFV